MTVQRDPRGLATVAFLKTKLDEGCDHLGLFEPLLYDALLNFVGDDFVAADIRQLVQERTQMLMPIAAVQTLLSRCAKKGLLTRRGGRFFRTARAIPDPCLEANASLIHTSQVRLGERLRQYALQRGIDLPDAQAALASLATFVSDNKAPLILRERLADSPLERSSLDRKLTRTIAYFITECCSDGTDLQEPLAGLVEGILLTDTLLMVDLPDLGTRFQNLEVYFDTSVVFDLLDLTGKANSLASREALILLKQSGARTLVFDQTVAEVRRILAVYELRLSTTEGRLGLYPTPLTQHVLAHRLSSADVRMLSITVESELSKLGVGTKRVPSRDSRYTLGEAELARCLDDSDNPDIDSPRVRHDVNCVAGVLTLRRGRHSSSVERAVAVFCSASGRTIRNTQQWYASEGQQGIPPIIHHAALTSIAWLKKPAAAPNVMMHELAAVCAAVMRPARATMIRMQDTLRRFRHEGKISDDETAAIIASELMEPLLARLDEEFEPDADSIGEAIERVRDAYRQEARAEAAAAMRHADVRIAEADRKVERFQLEANLIREKASDDVLKALSTAEMAKADSQALVTRIRERAELWGARLGSSIFAIAGILMTAAAVLSFPGVFDSIGGVGLWVARIVVAAGLLCGLVFAMRGGSVADLRAALRARLVEWLERYFTGRVD